MNQAIIIGRLTADPSLKFATGTGNAVTTFTLAADRPYVGQSGQKEVDFLNCVAFKQRAESIANNLQKGRLVSVRGPIQTRKYQAQDGTNRYVTEIIVDEITFLDYAKDGQNRGQQGGGNEYDGTGFMPVEDDSVPF